MDEIMKACWGTEVKGTIEIYWAICHRLPFRPEIY